MGLISIRRKAILLGTLAALVAIAGVFAPSAGAELIHVKPGQVAGVTPVNGVSPAAIPGHLVPRDSLAAGLAPSSGILQYHDGPVLHASSPFLIFWDPGGQLSNADKTLFERYFADVAHDSGLSSNVYGVDRQFTDASGFADYSQTWSAGHAITDTQPYPPSADQCDENSGFTETACLFDGQIQAEVQRVVAADGLPTGLVGSAPIYFVVTPPTVNSCFPDDFTCADDFFCAYHSEFTSGSGQGLLYADIPTLLALNDPKGCQSDNLAPPNANVVQSPNGDPLVDVALKYMSHEDNETITDPLGNAWWAPVVGPDGPTTSEDGDNCNFTGPPDPDNGTNPNAFLPTLGGSPSAGTLFDQLISGDKYYIQSEWSNGDGTCEMRPSHTGTGPVAAFSGPSFASQGVTVAFNPSASSNPNGYTSTTWDFGDGSGSFARSAPVSVSHAFSTGGAHTVKLTLVDRFGNLSSVSHVVNLPQAAFSATTAHPVAASPVSFDGSGSSAPGSSVSTFSWNFGDGATGTGATASHAYSAAGRYNVALTITDAHGDHASVSHSVTVVGVPSAVISAGAPQAVAGVPVALSAAHSTDIGSSISSTSWNFGDGTTGSGASVSHRFRRTGTLPVSLTVADASGATSTTSLNLAVVSPVITSVKVKKGKKVEKVKATVNGPGKLRLGPKTVNAPRPGTFTITVKLSKSQRARLKAHHSVTLRVKLKFVPTFGSASSKPLKIKIPG